MPPLPYCSPVKLFAVQLTYYMWDKSTPLLNSISWVKNSLLILLSPSIVTNLCVVLGWAQALCAASGPSIP